MAQVNPAGQSALDILHSVRYRTDMYNEVVELCTQYIESHKPILK